MNFGFYLLGKKGHQCLTRFVDEYGTENIAFVVSARDNGVKKDYFDEISQFCSDLSIKFFSRSDRCFVVSDVDFAIGWRWLISNSNRLIVFHDSLLPRYRGFAPLVSMLINGENKIGLTALEASKDYDAGNVIDQESVVVQYPIKILDAIDSLSHLYGEVLLGISERLFSGEELPSISQDSSMATYSLWRNDQDYVINWEKDSLYICRFIDAVGYPYSGAKTKFFGTWVRIFDAEPVDDVVVEDRFTHLGKVIFMSSGAPAVVCGDGLIRLKSIIDEEGNSLIGKIPFRTRFGV